mgnify:CR=1 FL=1
MNVTEVGIYGGTDEPNLGMIELDVWNKQFAFTHTFPSFFILAILQLHGTIIDNALIALE